MELTEAINGLGRITPRAKHNICEHCQPPTEQYSYDIADAGICGKCGKHAECWDVDLIDFYRELGLTDNDIFSYVPRLRESGIGPHYEMKMSALGRQLKTALSHK